MHFICLFIYFTANTFNNLILLMLRLVIKLKRTFSYPQYMLWSGFCPTVRAPMLSCAHSLSC